MPILHEFIAEENDVDILRDLLTLRENPNSPDPMGKTPIHIAIMKRERSPTELNEVLLMIRELIRFGANVNQADATGSTPLHFATISRDYKVIKTLLEANAEIDCINNKGFAALHYATTLASIQRETGIFAYKSDPRVVKLLLRYNPDVNIRTLENDTPLILAVEDNNLDNVRSLLKKNVNVNLQNSHGNTAMHFALNRQDVNLDILLELFRNRCSFSLTNINRNSPRTDYFQQLYVSCTPAQVEKAKQVIKIFMLDDENNDDFEVECITRIHKHNKSCNLMSFLKSCNKEIKKMKKDSLPHNYRVFHVAKSHDYRRCFESDIHIAGEIFDNVIDKLIKREYPMYCDVIALGINRSYMVKKFVDICCNRQSGIGISNFDELQFLSKYLSNFDLLKMIAAFSKKRNIRYFM